ncbi:MAG: Ig-like domain repeat protein, partial [Anaerolineales bacterium]|nr:Ig-like domain repeat protein [Anaerolineales bacterium]
YCCQFGYCVIKNKADCGQDDPPPPSPPTISANLNCSNWGDNGWCKGSLSIDLSAADPQGQAVVISGAVNGNNFACPSGATSCSIPLSGEGTGSVSYQVNSATGLSAAGSLGYQIDLTSPNLDTSVSGAGGTNGWYRSDVTLGVSASDATSGIASITASINGGGATSVGGSLTFSNGEYSVLIVARDNAGHVTQDTQTIKVDTITPSLSFTSSGTNGKNGWYVSSASAAATASDVGSGLASIEASVDGGTWVVSDSISLGDGVHTYQFRATDVAGNKTETPTQTALVDTIAPSISMSQGTSLGEKVLYEIEDYGSGLSIFRAVIEDDDEAYQKVTWSGDISGSYIADDILWDGKFADGARAGIGEYMVTLKITDAAGNKAIKATFVTVGLLDLLDDIPAFSPPVSSTSEEDEIPTTASTTGPQTFGGIPTTTNAGEFISTTTTVSGITIPTTNIPLDPNILWGAAATAMVGATLADWQKKREEEARRKAEAQEEKRANTEKRWGQKKAEDAVRQRW